jgi:hypothetical protein
MFIPGLMFGCIANFTALGCDVDDGDAREQELVGEDRAARGEWSEGELPEDPSLAPEKGPSELGIATPEPSAAWCAGWPTGDFCLARCSNGGWYNVGHWTSIPYGHCTAAGQSFCGYYGMGHTGACWGFP